MAESGKVVSAVGAEVHALRLGETLMPLDGALTPVTIFHEVVVSMAHVNGIIEVTLANSSAMPDAEGSLVRRLNVCAVLKSNIPAAIALRDALNGALLLAQPVEKPEGPKN